VSKQKLTEQKRQEKLEAKLRARQIRNKYKTMQAITGNANLSSSYSRVRKHLLKAVDKYGYAVDVNKGNPLDKNEYELAS
jgi:hypothetical protein